MPASLLHICQRLFIMRTIIDITNEQARQLAEICRKEDVSRTEAIKRAIVLFLDAHRHPTKHSAFGRDAALMALRISSPSAMNGKRDPRTSIPIF